MFTRSSTDAAVPAEGPGTGQRLRIALYSHDTLGLGHMRRNLLLAQAFTAPPLHAAILLISGASTARAFAAPPGVDWLTLPALHKHQDGHYDARSLGVALPELVTLRAQTIRASLEAFRPDLLIVDKVPWGAFRELEPALAALRAQGTTRCVLGLRDVLDEPAAVHREWWGNGNDEAIRAYYDAVWVYGDPVVYDPVQEYHFSDDVAGKVRYTGYLDQRARQTAPDAVPDGTAVPVPDEPFVLCAVGGGQDGAALAETFAAAELPPGRRGVLLTGACLPDAARARVRQAAAENARLQVHDFMADPIPLVRAAERVVIMGGYNTVCEALSFEKPALVVPRVEPRQEQWIRARRLHQLGLLDVLHPAMLTSRALSAWMRQDRPAPHVHESIDMRGLTRLPALLDEVLAPAAWAAAGLVEVRHAVR
ncbi:MAG TPA: glycosyltransferase [Chloroflexia bacterium]|nr:glycosyltransferase [Chloroflexia bacterium]